MTRFSSCWIILVFLAAIATASPGELTAVDPVKAGFDASKLSQVETAIQKHIDAEELAGAIGLVMRDNKIVFSQEWGQRDREKQLPMTDDTIFRIYSMTKPITSVAAMTLVENGQLALDDPISKYLPELAERKVLVEVKGGGEVTTKEIPAKREVTVRDFLRHTSGLTYGFFGDSEVDKMYRSAFVLITDRTLEDTITKLAAIPLNHQPGTRWHYSVSTDVLGRIIEVASGQTLDQYFKEQIFEPLNMHDTFFTVPEEKLARLAQMYTPDSNGGLKPASPLQSLRFVSPTNRFFSGGGGLCSTTADYLAFCQMLLNGGKYGEHRILKPVTVREMTADQLRRIPERSPGFKFGLGFAIDDVGAYGWGGAAGTRFSIDPRHELIFLYMVQINPTGKFDFSSEMKRLIYSAMKRRSP